MSASTTKKKRGAPTEHPVSTTQPNLITSLLDCYDFLTTNEYSDKTIGIQAFLTRKSVGDINFSDIIDDSDRRHHQGQQASFDDILIVKRAGLPAIDASIEKCMMLNRLIFYIKQNPAQFTRLMSDVRLEMQYKMTDSQKGQQSYDFSKRQEEFNVRKTAQETRRLYQRSDAEVNEPKNLVYLQNRTTQHLKSVIERMPRDSKGRQACYTELETIFRTSFMIVTQPRSGVIPVTIYERKGPGEYTAKISVTIVSLLHDFIRENPDKIELFDIEPNLCPSSPHYKLEEPRTLSWRPYQLQTAPGGKSQTFLCAELSTITIQQSSKTDARVRFAQALHSFKFAIKLQLTFADSKMPPVFQIPLESLVFGIGAHNTQIPQLLTRVILSDIRLFSPNQSPDLKTIFYFMERYFIHRTGVSPNDCVKVYLEQELIRATNARSSFQSLEDIYLDFLVNFVHQVEFMAKHPVLAMFHADGLFLGICNSERAAEAIVQTTKSGSPVIGLRFNSIRIDYNAIATQTTTNRPVKYGPCAVRVDIYNDRGKGLQNRTFDSGALANDISKFIVSAHAEKTNSSHIRILCNFDDRSNNRTHLTFDQFDKYYDSRLQEITKDDEKYKPVTHFLDNVNNGNTDDDNSDHHARDSYGSLPSVTSSLPPLSPSIFENDHSPDAISMHDYSSMAYASSTNGIVSPQSVLSPSPQAPYVNTQEAVLKFILSQPNLAEHVIRQYGGCTTPTSMGASQQQFPVQLPSQGTFQQPMFQPPYVHQSSQMFQQQQQQQQQMPMQFHQPITQQQQSPSMQFYQPVMQQQQQHQVMYAQQRQTSPSVIHYLPHNTDQPLTSIQQTEEDFPFINTDDMRNVPPQFLEQINILNLSDGNFNQSVANSIQQEITADEIPISLDDQAILQYLGDLNKPTSTNTNH